jgi:DNA-binding CsgD family transcriptional regulator
LRDEGGAVVVKDWARQQAAGGPALLDVLATGDPPALATDNNHRIVFWNRGAERIFGRSAAEALGRHCYDVLAGRDVFGNRYCRPDCSVMAMSRRKEPVNGFEIQVSPTGIATKALNVTILQIPGSRPELFTVVHILQQIDEGSRFGRLVASAAGRAAAQPLLTVTRRGEPAAAAAPPLTQREKEILSWVAEGLQNKEIADKLDISLATVRNHIHNILEKLEVHSKLEALSLAFRNGWIGRSAPGSAPTTESPRLCVPA